MSKAKYNFIQQQGFEGELEESAVVHSPVLYEVYSIIALIGTIQNPKIKWDTDLNG